MDLILLRQIKTDKSTIGELNVDGKHECFILEDVDRGLDSHMTLTEISQKKIHGKTAIPTGRYEIAITWSNKFGRLMPLLINVPGYDGIRIHWGNIAENTDGCLLTGTTHSENFVGESRIAFDKFFSKLEVALKLSKVFITIQ